MSDPLKSNMRCLSHSYSMSHEQTANALLYPYILIFQYEYILHNKNVKCKSVLWTTNFHSGTFFTKIKIPLYKNSSRDNNTTSLTSHLEPFNVMRNLKIAYRLEEKHEKRIFL